jgi:dolichyl-diphosphooligosaccharide--protein glycosyltransferase
MTRGQAMMLRIQVITIGILILALTVVFFAPRGYFGPISARVRGLFVKHTKTGNPLVDSVAEHQPANNSAYFQYLQHLCLFGPIGFFLLFKYFGDGPSFVLVYSLTAYYFSNKMVRLILLMGPVTSILGGIAVGRIVSWSTKLLWSSDDESNDTVTDTIEELSNTKPAKIKKVVSKSKFDTMKKKGNAKASAKSENDSNIPFLTKKESLLLKRVIAVCILWALYLFANSFVDYCWRLSYGISQATIIQTARNRHDDSLVLIDDYRQAYWWLRDNTPEDSRVLAWWDYGYQITAIANRTTIADGNTWNHEHIALLGKVLTTNFEEGYSIARHLADYVLIWAGGGGDDLAKSPHLARIANSVYRDMCPGDPTCRGFGFLDQARTPSSMMRASFLYKLHSHNIVPGVTVDPTKFKEVYTSKYGKVRIFQLIGVDQESRAWVADPKNRVCDVEGGWFCRGQYPPALREVLAKKVDFAQLEDFNVKKSDSEYQKQYFENLNNAKKLQSDILVSEKQKLLQERLDQLQQEENEDVSVEKPSQEAINALYNKWEDTDYTTLMWRVISQGKSEELESMLDTNPIMAFMRSSDGRGPMWWAFENRKQEIVKILMRHGVPHTDKDKYGKTPVDLLDSSL